jgi:uncharacterized protein YqgC (DUF456 family)
MWSNGMGMEWAAWALSVALDCGIGLAGTVLPALPGPALVLAGIVVGACHRRLHPRRQLDDRHRRRR